MLFIYVVNSKGIATDPNKVAAIMNFSDFGDRFFFWSDKPSKETYGKAEPP